MTTHNRLATTVLAGLTISAFLLTTAVQAAVPQAKKAGKKKPAASSAALIAQGKKVLEANRCKGCHTIGAEGGKGAPNLTKTGAVASHTVKWLMDEVANPKLHNPSGHMPAYAEKIKGADLKALGTYLASLKK